MKVDWRTRGGDCAEGEVGAGQLSGRRSGGAGASSGLPVGEGEAERKRKWIPGVWALVRGKVPGVRGPGAASEGFRASGQGRRRVSPQNCSCCPPHVIPPTVVKTDGQTTWMTNQEKPRSPDVD